VDIQEIAEDVHCIVHHIESRGLTDEPIYRDLMDFLDALGQYESVRLSHESECYVDALLMQLSRILENLADLEQMNHHWKGLISSVGTQIKHLVSALSSLPRDQCFAGN